MIALGWTLARAGGWPRMCLIAFCTAVASGLLLVAAAMLNLPEQPQENLFSLVAEPRLREGTVFATALMTVPVLLLLYQGIRLGTAARERRFAALRIAGALPNDVRKLGAIEVGVPALAGGLGGILVYALLRVVLGGTVPDDSGTSLFAGDGGLALVPTSVIPSWWQFLLVLAAVGGFGAGIGWRVSSRVTVSPLGVSRSVQATPPRPWGLLALLLAPIALLVLAGYTNSTLAGIAAVSLAVLGIASLSSWTAYRLGRLAEKRGTSPATLLAARRLITEPRPAGRAGAAIGGIGLVAGGAASLVADVLRPPGPVDPFHATSLLLVAVALAMALVAAAGSLAVHSVESLLDRRRSTASLAAAGTPFEVLEKALRHEAALVALPLAAIGALLGSLAVGATWIRGFGGLLIVLVGSVLVLGLVWLAVHAATRAVRPWLVRAVASENLRTE